MTAFSIQPIGEEREDDIRAEARSAIFFALREAFERRTAEAGVLAKDLAEALSKDKGYVSRALNGVQGLDYESLCVFLNALGFHAPLRICSVEEMNCEKPNFSAYPGWHRPASTVTAVESAATKAQQRLMKPRPAGSSYYGRRMDTSPGTGNLPEQLKESQLSRVDAR